MYGRLVNTTIALFFVSYAWRRHYPSSAGMTLLLWWYASNPILPIHPILPILPIHPTNVSPCALNVVRVIAYVSRHGISNAATTTNFARQRPTKRRDETLLLYDVVRWLCTYICDNEADSQCRHGFGVGSKQRTRDMLMFGISALGFLVRCEVDASI